MRTRILLVVVLALPLWVAEGRAQSYTLKIKENPAVGKSVTASENGTMRIAFVLSQGGMVLKDEKTTTVEETQYTTKVLEAGDPKPKKFSRTYTKATKGDKGNVAKLFYQGETVLFELKGSQYEATLQSGPVNDPMKLAELAELGKSASKDGETSAMLPKTAVKVGDTWPVAKETLEKILPDLKEDADLANSKVQGKLVKAYKKDGQQWGTLEFTLHVPMKKVGPIALDKPIAMQMKITLDTAIDGSSTAGQSSATVTFKGSSTFVQDNTTFQFEMSMEGEYRSEHGAEK